MMIEIKRQRTLADDMVYGAVVSKEHLLYKINEVADFSFVNRDMARFYHVKLGRIAIEPEILARAMVVQYLYNWSDRVCADMVANHITVKWFVGLGVEQQGFDFSLLSKHRKRLRENDQERMVFDAIVEQLIKAGYIGRKEKVLMDATHLAADVAIPTVTRLVRDAIELMLEVMEQEARPLWDEAVTAGNISDDAPVLDAIERIENTFAIRIENSPATPSTEPAPSAKPWPRKAQPSWRPLPGPPTKKASSPATSFATTKPPAV